MALTINMTWPASLHLCIPSIDCSDMEIISPSKATEYDSHVTINDAFDERNRVCDDDRYRIIQQSGTPLECCKRAASFERTLVILLESPHKSEYQFNCIDQPIGPAQGTTGRNIRDYLMDVVRSCHHIHDRLDNRSTRIMLANPIQFQTSLAAIVQVQNWREIRDAVWRALWDRPEIKDEFKVRLRSYNPGFIINACTHDLECDTHCLDGDNAEAPECRKRKISDFLVDNFPCAHIYAAAHPASWHSSTHRTLSLMRPILAAQPSPLTEANLDGATLTVTLPSGTTFESGVSASSFDLVTGIHDVSVAQVSSVSSGDTTAQLTLTFSGDFIGAETLAVRVLTAAHSGCGDLISAALCVSRTPPG